MKPPEFLSQELSVAQSWKGRLQHLWISLEASHSEEILKTEKSCLLQVAGLAALEIGSTLQWDYEENGKLQDKIILKFEGKKKKQKKPVPLPAAWKRPFPLQANICQVRALITVSQSYIMQLSQVNLNS